MADCVKAAIRTDRDRDEAMRKLLILTAAGSLLFGCGTVYRAHMVTQPGSATDDPNAPVNEAVRPGLIRYLNAGANFVRERRRAEAYRMMREACGGDYRIDTEGPQLRDGIVIAEEDMAFTMQSEYLYIQFSCVRP